MVNFSFEGEFGGADTILVSESIELNNKNVIRAKISIDETALTPDPSNYTFYLTNNGGTAWSEVNNNEWYTFTTVGQDLRYKISAVGGSILKIRQTDGTDYPIRVLNE